jgi:hypothetical protein
LRSLICTGALALTVLVVGLFFMSIELIAARK